MIRDVMVPRSDMVVLNYEDEIDEMRRTISKAHHTCYPSAWTTRTTSWDSSM